MSVLRLSSLTCEAAAPSDADAAAPSFNPEQPAIATTKAPTTASATNNDMAAERRGLFIELQTILFTDSRAKILADKTALALNGYRCFTIRGLPANLADGPACSAHLLCIKNVAVQAVARFPYTRKRQRQIHANVAGPVERTAVLIAHAHTRPLVEQPLNIAAMLAAPLWECGQMAG